MSFTPETAKAAGKKSKRGPAKILPPNTKEKLNILYEGYQSCSTAGASMGRSRSAAALRMRG